MSQSEPARRKTEREQDHARGRAWLFLPVAIATLCAGATALFWVVGYALGGDTFGIVMLGPAHSPSDARIYVSVVLAFAVTFAIAYRKLGRTGR